MLNWGSVRNPSAGLAVLFETLGATVALHVVDFTFQSGFRIPFWYRVLLISGEFDSGGLHLQTARSMMGPELVRVCLVRPVNANQVICEFVMGTRKSKSGHVATSTVLSGARARRRLARGRNLFSGADVTGQTL